MAVSKKKIASIRVSYEHGIETIRALAARHDVAPSTIITLAKREKWTRGKTAQETNKRIEKRALETFVRKRADSLAEFTAKHLSGINGIRTLTNVNLGNLSSAAREAKAENAALDRDACEAFFSMQKVLKISSETLTNCYREERLAMGINDNKTEAVLSLGEISEQDVIRVQDLFDSITK